MLAHQCYWTTHITRPFEDAMAAQKSGSIINIGSMMGMVGVEPTNYEGS